MEKFKEFEDNTLDEAIRAACRFFDATREKLEIELVQDAKNGIFGLVGARKALIRARLHQANSAVNNLKQKSLSTVDPNTELSKKEKHSKPKLQKNYKDSQEKANSEAIQAVQSVLLEVSNHKKCKKNKKDSHQKQKQPKVLLEYKKQEGLSQEYSLSGEQGLAFEDHEPVDNSLISLHNFNQDELILKTKEVVKNLLMPIVGDVVVDVTVFDNRLSVHLDCGEFSGLIIGREGQTLVALQYLSSRILTRIFGSLVRVQFDVGDYRERQDDRLREIALSLAERVRSLGRSCSTRPMSSYHRRIIHLALQEFPDIYTRSSGEGVLKRVIVHYKRKIK